MIGLNSKWLVGGLLFLAVFGLFGLAGSASALGADGIAQDDPAATENPDCISGLAWFDGNHNGVQDENEDVMDGARVDLFAVGPFDLRPGTLWLASSLLTRDGGEFEFCRVRPGSYFLVLHPPEGILTDHLQITAGSNPTTVIEFARGDNVIVNFGLAAPRVLESNARLPIPRR